MIRELIERAASGRSVYVTELHARFDGLAEAESDPIALSVEPLGGGDPRRLDLRLPRLDGLDGAERGFVESYLHAEVYNLLSALGGRSATILVDRRRPEAAELASRLPAVFGIGLPRRARSGYGRAVNVIDRILGAMDPGAPAFAFRLGDLADEPAPRARAGAGNGPRGDPPLAPRGGSGPAAERGFARRSEGLEGKALCGVDVGGTDIKAVLVDDGRVVAFKEYDWFPAAFLRSRQLIDPIDLIVRLMRARLWLHRMPAGDPRRAAWLERITRAMGKGAGDAEMEGALAALQAGGLEGAPRFDGIGLCFPDVVIRNKIVGGEVYKTRGIRSNPDIDYERDFAELTDLDLALRAWARPGGAVRIVNDGPMAAFTAAVEMAAAPGSPGPSEGVFAHTLGTELGTGWVTGAGEIPEIPLEVYNFIVDLGCWPERAFEPDDARSVNNFNTGLPGTLQKYCSQSGAFRLALKYFPSERPDLFRELREKGFVEKRAKGGVEGWYVPTEPADLRKPFLEHLMALPDREGDETNARIWREIGEALGATSIETRRILDPGIDERYLFGRMVKSGACFGLMAEGARSVDPRTSLVVAGAGMANTRLMKQLEGHPEFTVAQFAQAVGAAYFANE